MTEKRGGMGGERETVGGEGTQEKKVYVSLNKIMHTTLRTVQSVYKCRFLSCMDTYI